MALVFQGLGVPSEEEFGMRRVIVYRGGRV